MPFQYGCFISFRHLPRIERFVRQLKEDIETELKYQGVPLEVFLDEERIKIGDNFNAIIPNALCKSIVMVVVYVPAYFNADKDYCTREFIAFIEHERRRLDEIKQKHPNADHAKMHQIIPLLMRKDKNRALPEELAKDRNLVDWSDDKNTALVYPSQFSKGIAQRLVVSQITEKIREIWQLAPQLDVLADCNQYATLPDTQHPLFAKLTMNHPPPFPS